MLIVILFIYLEEHLHTVSSDAKGKICDITCFLLNIIIKATLGPPLQVTDQVFVMSQLCTLNKKYFLCSTCKHLLKVVKGSISTQNQNYFFIAYRVFPFVFCCVKLTKQWQKTE